MDKRVSKTRDAIIDAYLELIYEKKDQKITISELAHRANIARKTFYLHYETLEDIMRDAAHRKIDELLHLLEKKRFFSNPFELDVLFQCLNQLMEPDIEFYRFISRENPYAFFWSEVKRIIIETTVEVYQDKVDFPAQELRLYAEYFVSGVIAVYVAWLRGELTLPLSELARISGEATSHGIRKPEKLKE